MLKVGDVFRYNDTYKINNDEFKVTSIDKEGRLDLICVKGFFWKTGKTWTRHPPVSDNQIIILTINKKCNKPEWF